ncbi:hypothetical protein OROGR_008840 [Orobanche gracilis]
MPLKEPIFTIKKPRFKPSASTEQQTEFFDKDCQTLAQPSIAFVFKNIAAITEANNLDVSLGYALRGLKLHQKNHKVLSYKNLKLRREGAKRIEFWEHICFTAKPKKSDVPPKHFLVELMFNLGTCSWNVRRCCAFEPKDYVAGGLGHGCIICTNDQKIHPGPDEYYAGFVQTCHAQNWATKGR